ncbi:MAG: SDR family oxidoreductase [Rhizobiaceae bacterium]|nr:SDR family oxidoreductase [Rhizobiaceae bacterium]
MSGRVAEKTALVFGAGSSGEGLSNGRAIAVLLGREGANVMASAISQEAADLTAEQIGREGGSVLAHRADVCDSSSVSDAVAQCIQCFGGIDILVNNVGISQLGDLVETTEGDWDRIMAVNLKGPFLTCRAVLPHMLKRRSGAIVNISTVASIRAPRASLASYNASKAGVNQLTRTIALRYAREGIRANAVLPGLIDTPMVRNQLLEHYGTVEHLIEKRNAESPTGRMGQPWDVAFATLYLASDESAFVNGILLPVDGGSSAMMP